MTRPRGSWSKRQPLAPGGLKSDKTDETIKEMMKMKVFRNQDGVRIEEAGQNVNHWLLYGLGMEEAGQNINRWLLSRSAKSLALSLSI
jgi:hypothetical protein